MEPVLYQSEEGKLCVKMKSWPAKALGAPSCTCERGKERGGVEARHRIVDDDNSIRGVEPCPAATWRKEERDRRAFASLRCETACPPRVSA